MVVVPLIVDVGWILRLSVIVCIEILSLYLEFRNSTYSIFLSLKVVPGIAQLVIQTKAVLLLVLSLS